MKNFGLRAAVTAATLFASTALASIDPIVIKGSKFFYKTNGTQFYIRGVAYQQDYSGNGSTTSSSTTTSTYTDPLSDSTSCKRDIPYLQQLRTNTIRVYAIDPTKNHDDCMNALADAGIYVISDLSDPADSINRDSPAWNDALYTRYTAVVDALAKYDNTLGFFAGNEVSNAANNTGASAFVKAAVRDMKAYIKSKNYRTLGVGYASDDDASIRGPESDYLNCGDSASSIDFWGYNIYEWCGESSFTTSGYDQRTKEFANYSVPVFFAEYGCNDEPRLFGDTPVLFGPDMEDVWSGGIVYMYFQESNNFGLVSVDGSSVSTLSAFNSYSSQIASVSPTGVSMASYTPSNSARDCPSTGSSWAAVATPLPPTPNQQLCTCMYNSLSCIVKSTIKETAYEDLFNTVCGLGDATACNGINTNITTGSYGAYGMCNSTEQLAYAFNAYYAAQSSSAAACDFSGAATTQSAASATGSCASLVSQAGTAGTGTVTSSPTGTGSSGSSGSSSSQSSGLAVPVSIPFSSNNGWQMGSLVVLACLSGMGMVLL